MTSSDQKIGRSRWLTMAVVVVVVMILAGSRGTISAQTDTEHKARKALSDLQIDVTAPEPNIPIPEIYTTPPKIIEQMVGGAPEFKLFYFCRQHTSDELKTIVHEQFATKIFDPKGKSIEVPDYKVSSNPATNQLIVRCPTEEDANAVLELLEMVDVPPVQIKIDCLISEVYADFTFDRETTIAIEGLLSEDIALKPAGTAFGANVQELVLEDAFLPAFPGASLRELVRSRMGLNIGYLRTTQAGSFTALVDLLESRGYLKILMNPILETVNGKTATVKSTQHVPLQTVTKVAPGRGSVNNSGLVVTTEIEYIDVIDSLEITPHVFADGSIGLETSILLGSKNTPDGVKQVPIVTKKEITSKENRIRPGESLIIGGMRKTEEFAIVRGVPILKDIPLIGFLFSGEDIEQRAVETVFILTPTYSTGGRPRKEVMEEIRKKHEATSSDGLQKTMTDFFGGSKKEKQQEAREAEHARLEAEAEKALVRNAVREVETKTDRVTAEAQKATAEAQKLIAEAKIIMAQAEEKSKAADVTKAAAEKAAADAAKAKTDAEKLTAEAKKSKADAQKAVAQADKKTKEAEAAKAAADKTKAEADAKSKAAEQAKAEADAKAKAEADAKAKAAEKAKQEAEEQEAAEAEKPKQDSEKAEAQEPKEKPEAKAEEDKPKPEA